MPDGVAAHRVISDRFFKRLPPHIFASLTAEQRDAIAAAVHNRPGLRPAVNIRLNIPLLIGRYYLAIVAGRERRSAERLDEERVENPLRTSGNFFFVVAAAIVFYAAAVGGALLYIHSFLPDN